MDNFILNNFFANDFYKKLKKEVFSLNYKKSYIPNLHSYSKASLGKTLHSLFNSKEFLAFISKLMKKKIKNTGGEAFCFSNGDYTILSDKTKRKPGIDIIIDFTDKWNNNYGGKITYVDGKGNYYHLSVKGNSLFIVKRENIQRFVQYVNNKGKNNRRYFIIFSL
jgi:hypothetical protein